MSAFSDKWGLVVKAGTRVRPINGPSAGTMFVVHDADATRVVVKEIGTQAPLRAFHPRSLRYSIKGVWERVRR